MACFRSADVRQLLHNKFVIVLGDSIQRSVYKDLVKLLQDDKLLSKAQMKREGEMTFEKDSLVEGGILSGMQNGTAYREVRQYRSGHHLVRFYFISLVYSAYLESILSDFESGPQPDVLIVNSCVWDLTRYDNKHLEAYKTNLDQLFLRLKEVLSPECLIIWTMTMPVGCKDYFPENTAHNLQINIVEGNFFSGTLADFHKLDMHYHFCGELHLRCHDATHWIQLAHRKYSQILLYHIAMAWGVELPKSKIPECSTVHAAPTHLVTLGKNPKLHPRTNKRTPCSRGKILLLFASSEVVLKLQYSRQRLLCGSSCIDLDQSSVSVEPSYMPGYSTFNKRDTDSTSGPAFTHLPCAESKFLLPTKAPPMNFGNFPSRAP
ncbi:PC-esterase domain-containing protein 1A-like isoform X1 [Phyllobates terribilis]|uniref:PC-esterase domain-containing protein 1A-like isoform X1 n=1 Tax=Phyllobates terribilis TaxID=111132 RepID=UPI003CCAF6A6